MTTVVINTAPLRDHLSVAPSLQPAFNNNINLFERWQITLYLANGTWVADKKIKLANSPAASVSTTE